MHSWRIENYKIIHCSCKTDNKILLVILHLNVKDREKTAYLISKIKLECGKTIQFIKLINRDCTNENISYFSRELPNFCFQNLDQVLFLLTAIRL